MKLGTIIEMSDGRRGTVVYYSLDGNGIIWGEETFTPEQSWAAGAGHSLFSGGDKDLQAEYSIPCPEAMLRDDYPSAEVECVGDDYTIITEGVDPKAPKREAA